MPVRLYDRKDDKYPIIALVEHEEGYERIQSYSTKGRFYDVECHANDLFMAPVKREGWVNLYRSKDGDVVVSSMRKTEKEALTFKGICGDNYIATVKVEWEE